MHDRIFTGRNTVALQIGDIMLLNATYQVRSDGYPVQVFFEDGYQVSTKALLKIAPELIEMYTFSTIVEAAAVAQHAEYVGVWTDPKDNYTYIDLSAHYDVREDAIRAAKAMKEVAIFDWENLEDIRI
jgi:hypothetical protein